MAILELGNHSRLTPRPGTEGAPSVTYVDVPLGEGGSTMEPGLDADELRQHRADALLDNNGITRLPDHEAVLEVLDLWPHHATEKPAWIASDDEEAADLVRVLSEYWKIPAERPALVEDLYHTQYGPPGVGAWAAPVDALLTNGGRAVWANAIGNAKGTVQGVGTAATSTGFTAGGTPTLNAWSGARVYVYSTSTGFAWSNIFTNNTSGVCVIDQWYTLAGVAATTPTTPWGYYIDGGASAISTVGGGQKGAQWMGLTTTTYTPLVADTTLATTGGGEITTNGLGRALVTYAITSALGSTAVYTLTNTFTYTGSGAVVVTAIGIFTGAIVLSSGIMVFESNLNASATVNVNGDQITITESVTGS